MYIQLILYAIFAVVAWFVFVRRGPKKGKDIPGPSGLPIIGYAHKMDIETIHELFYGLAKQYGGIFKINSFGDNVVVLNDADIVRSIFCDDQYKRFTNDRPKIFWSDLVLFNCRGIFSTTNAYDLPHGELRKNFVRGMHVYGEGIPAFEEVVRSELVTVNELLERFNSKEFDMQTIIRNFLYDFISIFLSGQPVGDDDSRKMLMDFNSTSESLLNPLVSLALTTIPALRHVPCVFKRAFDDNIRARDAILQRYVHDAKRTYQPGQIRGLVDFYINEQRLTNLESCSDEAIGTMVLEIFFGGVMTTYSHLMSFFLCMMTYPDYQRQIQEEIDRVIGTHRTPSVTDKKECVFLEAVTLEIHRLFTTLPMPSPRMCKPNIAFEEYDIAEHSTILTNLWFIHHDEKVWGDPWTFRPERWIGDDGALLPNDHVLRKNFLTFNTGRRQCVGESLARSRVFLFVASLLQRWNFEMPPRHVVACDPRADNMQYDYLCRPKPYLCRAVPRKLIQQTNTSTEV